jgi:predicted metal-dependent hydrolase
VISKTNVIADTACSLMTVGGIDVEVVRKEIKNLHLSVLPPEGRVRVAIPRHVSDERVRAAIVSKLVWIKQQREEFAKQPRQSKREMLDGESHYFLGRKYRLEVIEQAGKPSIMIKGAKLQLRIPTGSDLDKRLQVLNEWYREQLKQRLPALLNSWQQKIGVEAQSWGIKKMKTKWGSCKIEAKRIWLNLELAKKPPECLEYILVHELVHLLERQHNTRFRNYMNLYMPNWRLHRDTLNTSPLAHEEWKY